MDARPPTATSKYPYSSQLFWVHPTSTSTPTISRFNNTGFAHPAVLPQYGTPQFTEPILHVALPAQLNPLPVVFPPHTGLYHAQLVHYNSLFVPSKVGSGLYAPPLAPLLSTSNFETSIDHHQPELRPAAKVSNKDAARAKPGNQDCHGNRAVPHISIKGDCALITAREIASSPRMPPSKKAPSSAPPAAGAQVLAVAPAKASENLPSRPTANGSASSANLSTNSQQIQSSSMPSTPHQHARKFSFGSREPSPNATQGHSPRSAYSETSGNLPSLRPLPPRNGGCKYETSLERSRRRMPYSLGDDRLERVESSKVKKQLSEEEEKVVTADMLELFGRLKPTAAVEAKRQRLTQKLEKLLNDQWPGRDIRVHLFGSSGNMLCSDDSDVDICITTPWKELEGVCLLADLFARNGMEKVVCVSSAKVPIVKMWDPELGLACDLNVNNTLALENTRMIKTYVEIDSRVRPLAMILKYWTRRRIINDAAFGGTLSSYTWICMIIAFLQLRKPQVLPALHQRPHQKVGKVQGDIAAFADDMSKLKGHGAQNKSSLGDLLFQFFRFYAHEFDYAENALSVRLGKLLKKTDKKQWLLANNSQLCVEEPFSTSRNLGNTADDTSFRGIHLELRRAFDLISDGKLTECCEQYIFPKEEERIFQKPASISRPVMVRSASQHHQNRNGRGNNSRGGRQQGQYRNNNHGNNRRASSTAYDNNTNPNSMYLPFFIPEGNVYYQPSPEALAQTLSALQMQENNLRFLQYTQTQAFAQQQALAHAQRMQGGASQPQTSTERSRTNSFDTPPMSVPLRPDMLYYPLHYQQGQSPYMHPGFSYPSSPANGASTEQRRTSHRSSNASDVGTNVPASSMRSQSQPAPRPIPTMPQVPGLPETEHVVNGFGHLPPRQVNGISIPSFIPDEGNDSEQEALGLKTPTVEESYSGLYIDPASPGRRPFAATSGLPAFGDIDPQNQSQSNRRRLSSDQFPTSILDRIKRTSRSPSPLGHARAFSVGTSSAPLSSGPFPTTLQKPFSNGAALPQDAKPVVVNGSVSKPSDFSPARRGPPPETAGSVESYDNALHINHYGSAGSAAAESIGGSIQSPAVENSGSGQPLVVNGSMNAIQSVHQNGFSHVKEFVPMTNGTSFNIPPFAPPPLGNTNQASYAALQRLPGRQPNSPLIAQLDLATSDGAHVGDMRHLSPVYETQTPSPTITRKFELPNHVNRGRIDQVVPPQKEAKQDLKPRDRDRLAADSLPVRAEPLSVEPRSNGAARENGHVRGAKSESDNLGTHGWQQIPRTRKKGLGKSKADIYPQSEQAPRNDAERKGG